jgi:hypothetical protein
MGSSLGIGVSSEGDPRRALHGSAIASGTSSQRRAAAGRSKYLAPQGWAGAGATLLSHGFRMLAELVRDGLATPRRDTIRMGEREITVARRRLDRGRTGPSNDRAQTIATSAITRRWPFGPGTRRCCRRCISMWRRSNLASRDAGTFPGNCLQGTIGTKSTRALNVN